MDEGRRSGSLSLRLATAGLALVLLPLLSMPGVVAQDDLAAGTEHPAIAMQWASDVILSSYGSDGGWYAGNTHVHSVQHGSGISPSAVTVAYMGARYDSVGFDFTVVTDHDVVTPLPQEDVFRFIQGSEVSSRRPGYNPHVIAVNITSSPEWRGVSEQDVLDAIAAQGGFAILAHPNAFKPDRTRLAWTPEDAATLGNYDGIEIYNHKVEWNNGHARSDPWATEQWFAALEAGKWVWGFSVDDVHGPEPLGHGYIVVQAPRAEPALLVEGMASGRFLAVVASTPGVPAVWPSSVATDGALLTVESAVDRPAAWIAVYDARGVVRAASPTGSLGYEISGDEGFLVVSLHSVDGDTIYLQPMKVVGPGPGAGSGRVGPSANVAAFHEFLGTGSESEPAAAGPSAAATRPTMLEPAHVPPSAATLAMFGLWVLALLGVMTFAVLAVRSR